MHLLEDIRAYKKNDPAARSAIEVMLLYNGLQELGIPCSRSQAAFYLFPDISEFGMDSFAFAELLLEQYGVATVPGVEFGRNGENHLRISYATSYEDCQEGLRRIGQCVRDLRSK